MRIPIGVSDFKELVTSVSSEGKRYLYCDKSMMIKDIVDDGAKVMLFTRPRRFGKTLNMSMLSYFFGSKEPLFDGLKIAQNQHIMDTYHGQYPVIFISFKDIKETNQEDMFAGLTSVIRELFSQFSYAFDTTSSQFKPYFDYGCPFSNNVFDQSIKLLTQVLHQYHNKQVIVLIDEYDTPLQTSYVHGFYEEIVTRLRMMFGAALKDNRALYKGVLTGITRIAQANLFSGLNHFDLYGIDNIDYAQYFGFTETEVQQICPTEHIAAIKDWYNGYTFGKLTIYNPWSVLQFLKHHFEPKAYWMNTAENSLIEKSLTADKMEEVQTLLNGDAIVLAIDNNLILKNLEKNSHAFFNLLYTAGYLTAAGGDPELEVGESRKERRVRIPNKEVKEFFKSTVLRWFGSGQDDGFLKNLLEDLIGGRIGNLQAKLQQLILETMSFHDVTENTQESFYHGFLLGLTLGLRGRYQVNSNRESGYGRYDIALFPKTPAKDPGVIIEIKMNNESAETALKQIEDKHYATELKRHGCTTIRAYGIHFDGKAVTTKMMAL